MERRGATGRVGSRVSEVEGTKEANRRIKQRKDVSPSNVGSWVRGGVRIEWCRRQKQ
jgi:hypothetical protein